MRSYEINNALPSTQELLSVTSKDRESFKPINFIADSIIFTLQSLPEYRGKMSLCPKIVPLISPFLDELRKTKEEIREHFDLKELDWLRAQMTVSSMANGDFLARHSDVNRFYGLNIELIFLLYFSKAPRKFSGGELILHWPDGDEVIQPEDNKFIMFPARLPHSVRAVVLDEEEFENTRFTVVGRIIGRAPPLELAVRTINKIHGLPRRIKRRIARIGSNLPSNS